MNFFITGTDTNVGKTLIASWLCLHHNFSYWKPIQTGSKEGTDSSLVYNLTKCTVYKENYIFSASFSPHLASLQENVNICIEKIQPPVNKNLIIEGAGGVLVPINKKGQLVRDLIAQLNVPVIIVARTTLGTINHTLLTLESLKKKNIPIAGIILSGIFNLNNIKAIAYYGKVPILQYFPQLTCIDRIQLSKIIVSNRLKKYLSC